MNRAAFYASLRSRTSGVFGTSLSASQVQGLEAILDEAERRGAPLKHLAYILATPYHEVGSSLQPKIESLTYTSAARIRAVWPSRFPTEASARPYVRNPQGLANFVYANRLGNGNAASGDGWKFRGDGLVQLTGKTNFDKFGVQPGMDLATSIRVMFDGMLKGMFTGKRLGDAGCADHGCYRHGRWRACAGLLCAGSQHCRADRQRHHHHDCRDKRRVRVGDH